MGGMILEYVHTVLKCIMRYLLSPVNKPSLHLILGQINVLRELNQLSTAHYNVRDYYQELKAAVQKAKHCILDGHCTHRLPREQRKRSSKYLQPLSLLR